MFGQMKYFLTPLYDLWVHLRKDDTDCFKQRVRNIIQIVAHCAPDEALPTEPGSYPMLIKCHIQEGNI